MVQRWKILASVVAFLLALPYALLMIAGGLWLYEHSLLPHFLAATSVAMLLGWFLARCVGSMKRPRLQATTPPSKNWPPAGDAAWRDVEAIAAKAEADPPPLDKPERWWELLRGTEMPRPRLNWLMRYGGLIMILTPLGVSWHLSESWILGLSLLIVVYGILVKTLKKTG